MVNVHPTDGPIHTWFGLSYSNYAVLHRTFLQSMPIEFQRRIVACLEELQAAYEHVPQPEVFNVEAATEHIVNEMSAAQLKQAGIVEDWYRGEVPPAGLDEQELAEWREKHEDPEGPSYSRDGEELDPHERVLIPCTDPVPHYNRGRTYIEPRLPEPEEKSSRPAADATPDRLASRERRLGQLLDTIRSRPGKWTTGLVQDIRRTTGGPVQRGTARRDLDELHRRGHLHKHGAGDGRYYTLRRRQGND